MPSEEELTLRQGRERYFAENGIAPDGGYDDDWVHLKFGPIPVRFPNTKSRREGVRFHDLNHVVTGYGTTLTGEAEIGAWELASGCHQYRAALVLNLLVMWPMLFVAPGRIWRAFHRGRHSSNLYGESFDEALVSRKLGKTRRQLGLDRHDEPVTAADRGAFALALAQVVGLQLLIVALLFGLPTLLFQAFA